MTSTQLTHYNKRCAEMMGYQLTKTSLRFYDKKIITAQINYEFDCKWENQIPVWQKVYGIVLETMSDNEAIRNYFRIKEMYYHEIDKGTPQTGFFYLCQAIDFIDNQSKQPIK